MSETVWKLKLTSDGTGFVGTVTIPPPQTEQQIKDAKAKAEAEEAAKKQRKAIEDAIIAVIGGNTRLTEQLKPLIDLLAGNEKSEFKGFGEKIDKLLNALLLDKDKKFRFGIPDWGLFRGFQEGFAANKSDTSLGGIVNAFRGVFGLGKKQEASPPPPPPLLPITQPRYLPVIGGGIFSGPHGIYGNTYADPTRAPDTVPEIPKLTDALTKFGKTLGKAFGGAAKGAQAAEAAKPITNLLGLKSSNTGAQIGGAIGAFIPIPGMDIVGGIVGSIVGGLFKKTPKGSVVITGGGAGDVDVSGNKAAVRERMTSAGTGVQKQLQALAETFGASVGDFRVSIGEYKGYFRVSASGSSNVGSKKFPKGAGSDLIYDGKDAEEAMRVAIRNAIQDGAIKGVSSAVQAALGSTTDIDAAIKEALKVDQLETLLGGIGAELRKTFKSFEQTAADRVRIARKYGFDLVKLEELNAKERAKLLETTLAGRVGPLQDFLKELGTGSLAEGSLTEQRDKLLVDIAKAKTNAEAGVEGSAAELAALQRRLLEVSREAFGTGSTEYANDRTNAKNAAQTVIDIETKRIKDQQEAAKAAQDKLDAGNALANEANNLLAQQLAALRQIAAAGGGYGGDAGGGHSFNTLRQVAL